MIRYGTTEDLEAILDMAECFWATTDYDEPFVRDHVRLTAAHCIDTDFMSVLDLGNGPVGFACGVASPLLANPNVFIGVEVAFWVDPEHRKGSQAVRLMKHLEKAAKHNGVKYWHMVSMECSAPEVSTAIYKSLGYVKTETSHKKEL